MINASFQLTLYRCVVSVCCVGGASLDIVLINFVNVPGILVCISFLISVCMYNVLKDLLISSAIVIVRAGEAIWLNPFATVLFSVCSAVTVECCVLYPCLHGCVWYVFLYVREKALLQCFCTITEKRDTCLYEMALFSSLLG